MKKNILLVNDTSLTCHHGCTLLMQSIYYLFKKNNLFIKNKIYLEQNALDFIESVNSFDLVLINGEGIIHGKQNADQNKVDEILNFIRIIKTEYDVPVVIFNSTISSLRNKHIKILKLVDKIYVREKYSFNYLKKNKINSSILPDLLSLLKIKGKKNKNKIIVTDSSIKKISHKLFNYADFKNYKYIPILYNNYLRYIRFFVFKFILKIKINFLVNIYLYLKNLYLQKFINEILDSKFIITGRFHGIFICLALMKPFYTFRSDTYKVKGLMEMIGIPQRIENPKNLNNLILKKFTKSEILKISNFKVYSKLKFNNFIGDIKKILKVK